MQWVTKIENVCNKHWLRLYGYSPEDLIFRSVRVFMEDLKTRSVRPHICFCLSNDNWITAEFDAGELTRFLCFRLDGAILLTTLHKGMHFHDCCVRMPIYYPIPL